LILVSLVLFAIWGVWAAFIFLDSPNSEGRDGLMFYGLLLFAFVALVWGLFEFIG
jgi:hypothetical protein